MHKCIDVWTIPIRLIVPVYYKVSMESEIFMKEHVSYLVILFMKRFTSKFRNLEIKPIFQITTNVKIKRAK